MIGMKVSRRCVDDDDDVDDWYPGVKICLC